MTIIKTYAKLNRKIRVCNKIIKRCRNEAKAFRAEGKYFEEKERLATLAFLDSC